jgi:transcriptional antiterminator RfaH
MPGSAGLVCFGAEPASVPDNLIAAIRRRVDEITSAGGEQLDGLQAGDAVTIAGGPFDGYQAIFDGRVSGNERVRVLLKFLRGRQMPVELPTGFVQKKKQRT